MSLRWISFVAYIWVGLAFLFGLTQLGINPHVGEDSQLQALMSFDLGRDFQLGSFTFILPNPSFLAGLIEALTFNYSFFEGDWTMFRTFFLFPIALATMLVVVIGVITPVFIGAATAFRNFFRF
ncbi:hypothetical protein LCGC14_2788880 [marine sediment metagenome]|uniref:Uncharacterized protein n=1 Tax=marine sediment metagenome TaxID=412755 RepID=A0A0F8YR76_9ZZZZ